MNCRYTYTIHAYILKNSDVSSKSQPSDISRLRIRSDDPPLFTEGSERGRDAGCRFSKDQDPQDPSPIGIIEKIIDFRSFAYLATKLLINNRCQLTYDRFPYFSCKSAYEISRVMHLQYTTYNTQLTLHTYNTQRVITL